MSCFGAASAKPANRGRFEEIKNPKKILQSALDLIWQFPVFTATLLSPPSSIQESFPVVTPL
jgi:hypothetical protein